MVKQLKPYIVLVDFLADFLGENTEVVLHDLTDWHCSIVAIRNGHISGRRVGSPVTDLALEMIKSEKYKNQGYRVNYRGVSQKGERIRSATCFLKDEEGELIGMICINMDCQKYVEVRDILESLIRINSTANEAEEENDQTVEEKFNIDVKDLVENNINRALPGMGSNVCELGKQEKIDLVGKLQAMGTFMVKGTIWNVADILGVSVPTVYRYIAIVKKQNE
ncbi:MAG: PAS domain-containing protein [Eubacterium sp.]